MLPFNSKTVISVLGKQRKIQCLGFPQILLEEVHVIVQKDDRHPAHQIYE